MIQLIVLKDNLTTIKEPSADDTCGFRRLAFTESEHDIGKQNEQQVNPSLRLAVRALGFIFMTTIKRLFKIYSTYELRS